MKRIFLCLFVGAMWCMAINAQVMQIYKDGKLVASYDKKNGYEFRLDKGQEAHDYVDLGLPSGTLWATCNVGATSAERCGNYYAWGETSVKNVYDWYTYTLCHKSSTSVEILKYLKSGAMGKPDNKMILEACDDVATAQWGSEWQTPTMAQMEELYKNCYFAWTDNYKNTGIKGRIVYKAKVGADKGLIEMTGHRPTGKYTTNDTHIFLPATGFYNNAQMDNLNRVGYYWTSTVYNLYSTDANRLQIMAGGVNIGNANRYYGYVIRPVHK